MRFALITSLCFAALVGCSANESDVASATAKAPLLSATDDLGTLVPADAVAFLYLPVPGEFQTAVKSLVSAINPGMADKFDAFEPFGAAGIDKNDIDISRPMALAVSLPSEGPPQPILTFIIPVKDAPASLAARAERGLPGSALAAGNYVGVSFHPAYAAGTATPAIAKNLAAGHVCARIDMKGLVARLGPMLDKFSNPAALAAINPEMAATPQAAETLGAMMKGARTFLDSLDSVQASVTFDGGVADIRAELTMVEGSKLDIPLAGGGFGDAAKSLAAKDAGFVFLARANWSSMMDLIEPMLQGLVEAMPPEQKQGMEHYLAKSRELYDSMGDTMAVAGDLTSEGMVMTGYANTKDVNKYLADYRELIESPMMKNFGAETMSLEPETVDGVEMQRFTLKFNTRDLLARSGGEELSPEAMEQAEAMMENMMNTMFGPDGFQYRIGAVGNNVVFAMGGDKENAARAVEAAKNKSGSLPPAAQAALDRVQGNASFLMYADCRQFLSWSMNLARSMQPELPIPPIPDGPAVPLLITASSDGATHVMNVRLDIAGIAKIMPSPQPR